LDTACEEGERKKQMEIAKTGLKEGLSIELIMKLTGLSKEEIENLKE
jgi:predicted transposase YdaD